MIQVSVSHFTKQKRHYFFVEILAVDFYFTTLTFAQNLKAYVLVIRISQLS